MLREKIRMLRRIFITPDNINGDTISIDEKSAHHIFNVLRLGAGDRFLALDGQGCEYEAEISDIRQRHAVIVSKSLQRSQVSTKMNLYLSIIKQPRFEWALEKCTELGISSFTPVKTERSIPVEFTENKIRRMNTIIEQSAEQSSRAILPIMHYELTLKQALEQAQSKGIILIADLNESDIRLSQIFCDRHFFCDRSSRIISASFPCRRESRKYADVPAFAGTNSDGNPTKNVTNEKHDCRAFQACNDINIFIGPEGGFTVDEIELAKKYGALSVCICENILRSETAAISMCAIVKYLLKESPNE